MELSSLLSFVASTLLAHANTYLLMISLVFLNVVSSHHFCHHIITVYTINKLFFSLLSFSLYPHSFAIFLRKPIHSSALSFCYLVSLQHCSDYIVPYIFGLEFTSNNKQSCTYSALLFFLHCFMICTTGVPLSLATLILSGISHYPVYYSYLSRKCFCFNVKTT